MFAGAMASSSLPVQGTAEYVESNQSASATVPMDGCHDERRLTHHLNAMVQFISMYPYEVAVAPEMLLFIDRPLANRDMSTFVALQIPNRNFRPLVQYGTPDWPVITGHSDLRNEETPPDYLHISIFWAVRFPDWQSRHRACFASRALLAGMLNSGVFVQFYAYSQSPSFRLREGCQLFELVHMIHDTIVPYTADVGTGPSPSYHVSWQL